jgi:uncharacterized protein YjbI with pentapeptide repeats
VNTAPGCRHTKGNGAEIVNFEIKHKGVSIMGKKGELTIVIAVACLFCIVTLVLGFDEKQVQALKKTNNCPKCDLSGAKLNDLDLSYADLSGANLSGADLTNSVLYQANVSKANLSGANLTNVNLFEANLTGATLTNANLTKTYVAQATWTDGRRCKVGSVGICK